MICTQILCAVLLFFSILLLGQALSVSVDSCCQVLLIYWQCVVLSTSCGVSEMAVGESVLPVSCLVVSQLSAGEL